jgi:hypothetical protein
VTVLDAGLGAAALLRRPVTGRVVSVHRRAAYLRLDGELVALVAAGVDPGPLHVRCAALPACRPGEAVRGDGGRLAGRTWALRGPGEVWRGTAPDTPALRDEELVRAALAPGEVIEAGEHALVTDGVAGVAAAVGGRGPGLTPSGDDLLAGVVLVARIAGGAAAEEGLAALVAGVRTTEVARAFLAWAARGQSIAPAHDWLDAVAAGDAAGARRALARLHAVGADSGRHLGAGLALGLCRTGAGQLPRVVSQTARATAGPSLRQRT